MFDPVEHNDDTLPMRGHAFRRALMAGVVSCALAAGASGACQGVDAAYADAGLDVAATSFNVFKGWQLQLMSAQAMASSKNAGVPIAVTGLTYNGSSRIVVRKRGGSTLSVPEGSSAQIDANGNVTAVNAGSYTAIATLQEGYAWSDGTVGDKMIAFSIAALPLTGASVTLSASEATYTGKAQAPTVEGVTCNGVQVGADDYDVTYYRVSDDQREQVTADQVTDAGSYVVKLSGKGNCTGSAEASFTIRKASLADATVKLSDESGTYTGAAQAPTVASVTLEGGAQATADEYDVAYYLGTTDPENKISADQVASAGTYVVAVTGKGNFTGAASVEYVIDPARLDAPQAASGLTYCCEAQVGVEAGTGYTLSVEGGSGAAIDADGNAVATDAGVYSVVATLEAGVSALGDEVNNYVWSDESVDAKTVGWSIARASLESATVAVSPTEQTYTGEPLAFDVVSVTLSGGTVVPEADYEIAYYKGTPGSGEPVDPAEGIVEVGDYYVVATSSEAASANYEGSASATFAVVPRRIEEPAPAAGLSYTGESQVGVAAGEGYTLSVASGSGAEIDAAGNAVATDVGTYAVTATLEAGCVWSDGSTAPREVSWSVSAASIEGATINLDSSSPVVYRDEIFSVTEVLLADGTKLSKNDYSLTYYLNGDEEEDIVSKIKSDGTYLIVATGKGNYEGTATTTFVVKPVLIDKPVAVTGLVYNGKIQRGVEAGTGYKLENIYEEITPGIYLATAVLKDGYAWRDEGEDHYKDDVDIEWSIAAKSETGVELTLNSSKATATGADIIPVIKSVKLSDGTKLKSTEYDVSYYFGQVSERTKVDAPKSVGTYIVVVTLKGNYTGAAQADFTIEAASDSNTSNESSNKGSSSSSSSSGSSSSGSGSARNTATSSDGSSSSSAATNSAKNSHVADENGWITFEAPGNSDTVAAIASTIKSIDPLDYGLVGACLVSLSGAILVTARRSKETDDLIDDTGRGVVMEEGPLDCEGAAEEGADE